MKKCKNCGQEFEDGANVCPVCGAADNGQSAKVCPNCKTEVSDNSNFCTNCGTPINGSAQSNNGDAQNNAGQNNFGGQNYRQPPYQPAYELCSEIEAVSGSFGNIPRRYRSTQFLFGIYYPCGCTDSGNFDYLRRRKYLGIY